MSDRKRILREEDGTDREQQSRLQRIGGTLAILATVVFGFILINSAYLAYADSLRAKGEKEKMDIRIEAMETRLEDETDRAISNLDPDYRRAVYERERGLMASGEELLPIYDEENEEK